MIKANICFSIFSNYHSIAINEGVVSNSLKNHWSKCPIFEETGNDKKEMTPTAAVTCVSVHSLLLWFDWR